MATGNDVREIFQLTKSSDPVKRVHKTEKKPDGISRELYGLIGNNVSTVAFNNPTYKPKLNVSKKAVNWTWRPFVNPSRDDDLILHHWEKTRTDPNEEYRFYKFNKSIDLKEFTPEEYTSHLQDSDWTLEETNYLWSLCRRFDLRWVVIQDRYEWPPQEQDRLALTYYNGNSISSVTANTNNNLNGSAASSTKTIEPSTAATSTPGNLTSTAETTSTTAPSTVTDGVNSLSTGPSLTLAPSGDGASSSKGNSVSAPSGFAPTPMEIVTFTPAKTRSMEDLKNRYYTINRILIRIQKSDPSQAVEKAQLLSSMAYDKNREVERKKNLEILNTRTPEQIEEEEALYLEARRIDQNEKKITRERENLLRLLNTRDIYGPGGPASAGLAGQVAGGGGPGTGIIIPSNSITIPSSSPSGSGATNGPISPSVGKNVNGATAAGGAGAPTAPPPKKRKKAPKGSTQAEETAAATAAAAAATAAAAAGAATSSASATKGSANNRRPSNASSINDGSSSNLPQGVQVKKEKLTPGAYLRSQKMTPIVSTKQQRVSATLTQLSMPIKPAMPTATIMAKWDQLNSNIVTLLDLKKQVDKLESDLKVFKMRRGSASGVGLFPASTTGTPSVPGGAAGATAGAVTSGGSAVSSTTGEGNFGVKREGTVDESGVPGQVKKKKRKE